MNDDEVVRRMLGNGSAYEPCADVRRCKIDWARGVIWWPTIQMPNSDGWVRMTPAVRRQLVRLAGGVLDDSRPEAWEALNFAIHNMKETFFHPRIVCGEGGEWWLQALCDPGHWPPSEADLFDMLSDVLTMYANPEYRDESHVVRRVEVTPRATIVAVTRDRTVSLGSGDDEAVFACGHYAYAMYGEVKVGRIWHDVRTDSAIIFAGSGDMHTGYRRDDFHRMLRRVRMGISRERDQRFGAHYRALDASRTHFEADPVHVINELRERHIPNGVLDAISERIRTTDHGQENSCFSIARAISSAATKNGSDPDVNLTLERFAGEYILAASKR